MANTQYFETQGSQEQKKRKTVFNHFEGRNEGTFGGRTPVNSFQPANKYKVPIKTRQSVAGAPHGKNPDMLPNIGKMMTTNRGFASS